MNVLITYDVSTETQAGRRRLRRISKACQDYGQRVQWSIFECKLDKTNWVVLRARLLNEMNDKKDSLRFYILSEDDLGKVEHHGCRKPLDLDAPLIV
ncbi:MAG: CRISPR-associated endonuclease Cas2 [Candidatus Alcyoniella australis]|nr:CRISPR-associated endonuclease Cas2 [Candidatus Alcyoniella australis]